MLRSLTLAAATGAFLLVGLPGGAQQMAAAPNVVPAQRHLVFMEDGGRLPRSAAETLRAAAAKASSAPVTIEGRPAQAAEVKRELMRLGAPSESIIVRPTPAAALPSPGDGRPNPAQRHVALNF